MAKKKLDTKHAHRDVMRALGWPKGAPQLVYIPIDEAETRHHPVICPIELLESIGEHKPDQFQQRFVGPTGAISEFWAGLGDHPIRRELGDLVNPDTTGVLGLHADGAATWKTEGLFSIAWNSVTSKGATKDTRNVYAVIRKSDLSDGTLLACWDYLAWALNAIARGRVPDRDHRGRRHARAGRRLRWQAATVQMRGDWEFYSQCLDMARWDGVPKMCFACGAEQGLDSNPDLSWTGASRGWERTIKTHESWVAELLARGKVPPIVFSIIGLRLEGVMIDVLHALDQGVTSHIIGNIWFEVMGAKFGGSLAEQVKALQADIKAWHKANGRKLALEGKLTPQRVRTSGDWPKLKAKGANTRHLVPYTLALAQANNSGNDHDNRRVALCQILDRFYTILESEGRWLSEAAKGEVEPMGKLLFNIYRNLSAEALRDPTKPRAWKMTQKFHLWEHLCSKQALTSKYLTLV